MKRSNIWPNTKGEAVLSASLKFKINVQILILIGKETITLFVMSLVIQYPIFESNIHSTIDIDYEMEREAKRFS